MQLSVDAAIVDLDGTLVDTVGDFEMALRLALANLGLPSVGRAFITRTVRNGSEHLLMQTLAELGAPAALYEQAWACTSTTTSSSTASTLLFTRVWLKACRHCSQRACGWLA